MSEVALIEGLNLSGLISKAPSPDDAVDLVKAKAQFESDVKNAAAIYANNKSDISLANNFTVILNHRDWSLFWSERHPRPEQRRKYKVAFARLDAAVQRITQKSRSILQKRYPLQ